MLHILATITFLGTGMFAITVIAASLLDNAASIAMALRLNPAASPLPARVNRVRVVRSPRLASMSPVRTRAAA